MKKSEIVCLMLVMLFSAISFIISYFQFREKGFLFNNAYIYASKEERRRMNKAPYYRQSAISFCILGVVFITSGLSIIPGLQWLISITIVLSILVIIYAIVSTVNILRKQK